ncbi:MAG: isoprenylcysteine carboxylmethyltransferase family protein [Candidatus Helarchaeota archaeon]|nr:isoprenylcysteine carboxylmethyltransferase family protein [Candidatus Helarchaeota archaeon]
MIRPISEKGEADKFSIIILILFLVSPIIHIIDYYENLYIISKHFPFWDNLVISYIGISLYILGGIVAIVSRIQLGKFGSGSLVIEEDHKLITKGIYQKIRHPMYSGALIGIIGSGLVFRTIFMLVSCFILYFFVFRQRIIVEERLLKGEFGEEYLSYMKKTKRLIPFIY